MMVTNILQKMKNIIANQKINKHFDINKCYLSNIDDIYIFQTPYVETFDKKIHRAKLIYSSVSSEYIVFSSTNNQINYCFINEQVIKDKKEIKEEIQKFKCKDLINKCLEIV